MKTVILISGGQGSGKSTTARLIHSELMAQNKISGCFKFASPLYDIHHAISRVFSTYGLSDFKGIDGALLQYLGTDWGRTRFGDDIWVRALRSSVGHFTKLHPDAFIIIDDVRFPNENNAFDFDDNAQILKLRLECGKDVRQRRAEKWRANDNHISERALDDAEFDMLIDTEKNKVGTVVNEVMKWISKIRA